MRKLGQLAASAAIAAFWISPSIAQQTDGAPSLPAASNTTITAQADPALDEVICKEGPPITGSRIGGTRVCKTRREWLQDQQSANMQRGIRDQTQNNTLAADSTVPHGIAVVR